MPTVKTGVLPTRRKTAAMSNDHRKMHQELLQDESDTMTAWEVEFIESLSRRHRDAALTRKQAAVLEKIWSKVFD